MEKLKAFLRRKDIEISIKRYGIDALGAMAQGLFCSLLIGTIINTLGTQFHISFLTTAVATVNDTQYTVGSLASAMSGPAMAVAIGYALHCPPLVLFSLITVGFASNALGGAGGPLAVLFVAIFASEIGKAVSKETKIDILVTPLVTIGIGVALSAWWAPALGSAAMKVGNIIMWATNLQPFLMGILVSVFVGIALTLPISSAAICAAPSVLAALGLLEGKNATAHAAFQDKLAGAHVLDTEVVVDGNITTSYGLGGAIPFALELVRQLAGEAEADRIRNAIAYRH